MTSEQRRVAEVVARLRVGICGPDQSPSEYLRAVMANYGTAHSYDVVICAGVELFERLEQECIANYRYTTVVDTPGFQVQMFRGYMLVCSPSLDPRLAIMVEKESSRAIHG